MFLLYQNILSNILHSKIFNVPYKNIHMNKGESLKVRSTEEYLGQSCDLSNPPTMSLCPKPLAFQGRRQGRQPLNILYNVYTGVYILNICIYIYVCTYVRT